MIRKYTLLLMSVLLLTNLAYTQCWQSVALCKNVNRGLWAIRKDGTLWMGGYTGVNEKWNFDASGTKNTTGTPVFSAFPTQVGFDNDWAKICASPTGSFYAIKKDGSLWAWGNNGNGELGLGNVFQYVAAPVQIGTDKDWKDIDAGGKFAFALKLDGSLWGWGLNNSYQLGDGTTVSKTVPTRLGNNNMGSTWSSFSCSENGVAAICTNGAPWAWGASMTFGYTTSGGSFRIPTRLGNFEEWRAASNGGSHALFISIDNMLFGMGKAQNCKQLGNDNVGTFNTPVPIGPIGLENAWNADWKSTLATSYTSFAIRKDGSLWRWGWNGPGSPCYNVNGKSNYDSIPVKLPLTKVDTIVASGWIWFGNNLTNFAAIHDNGKLSIWGNDITDPGNRYLATPQQIGMSQCPCLCSTTDRLEPFIKVFTKGKIIDSVTSGKALSRKLSCNVSYGFMANSFTDISTCTAYDSLVVKTSGGTVISAGIRVVKTAPFIVNFPKPGVYNLVYLLKKEGKTCSEYSVSLTVECTRDIRTETMPKDMKKATMIRQ